MKVFIIILKHPGDKESHCYNIKSTESSENKMTASTIHFKKLDYIVILVLTSLTEHIWIFSIILKCHIHHLDQLFIFNWVHSKLWASADTGVTQTFQLSLWQG